MPRGTKVKGYDGAAQTAQLPRKPMMGSWTGPPDVAPPVGCKTGPKLKLHGMHSGNEPLYPERRAHTWLA